MLARLPLLENRLRRVPVLAHGRAGYLFAMFKNKLCIVTGASTGIGAELARQLSARGARLVLVARSKQRLETLARTLPDARVVPLDLTAPDSVSELQRAVPSADVLINNAGFATYGRFAEVSLARQQQELAL